MKTPTAASDWPDKSPAQRERQRRAYERRYPEWLYVLSVVEKENRHPSPKYLAELITLFGVPDFAREYVAWRQTNSLPAGKPIKPPRRPTTVEEFDLACATGRYRYHGAIRIVSDGLTLDQGRLVRAFLRRYARYKAFETRRKPRMDNLHRLKFVKSQGVWKVKGPKELALKRVTRGRPVAVTTLLDWVKQVRQGPREF